MALKKSASDIADSIEDAIRATGGMTPSMAAGLRDSVRSEVKRCGYVGSDIESVTTSVLALLKAMLRRTA